MFFPSSDSEALAATGDHSIVAITLSSQIHTVCVCILLDKYIYI